MEISRLGVFAFLDSMEGAESAEFAHRVEGQGYSVLWIVEASGRNSLSFAPWLPARTESLVVATGRRERMGAGGEHDGGGCAHCRRTLWRTVHSRHRHQ
jgi:hypothetical protein